MTARRNDLAQAGVVVKNLYVGSPAAEAGIELRDIVLTVNGVKVASTQDTLTRIANAKPGSKVKITGLRGAEAETFSSEVLVTERPRPPLSATSGAARHIGKRRRSAGVRQTIGGNALTAGRRRRSRRSCAS